MMIRYAQTIRCSLCALSVWSLLLATLAFAKDAPVHEVHPGDDPQAVLDRAAPGSKLVFLSGLHSHRLKRHRAVLYVGKSVEIELQEGAVLKLADNVTQLRAKPEITIDHGAPKRLNDLDVDGSYDGAAGRCYFAIYIDGEGEGSRSDSFRWARLEKESDLHLAFPHNTIAITGDWQPLSNGVRIKFDSKTGHNRNSLWILSCGGEESYGIRVGHGTQVEPIEDVHIHGRGMIDMNQSNNVQPTEWVKDISSCLLIHGRVNRARVEGITMTDSMRSVMVYGEHTGRFLRGGGTEGGESFDAEDIAIVGTKTLNPLGKAYLLGHPSHRGRLRRVKCNQNFMVTAGTALEPNFNLDQYEVIGNTIRSGTLAIHCWRKSTNGIIADNIRIDDREGIEVVKVNSPSAWEDSENLLIRNNRLQKEQP